MVIENFANDEPIAMGKSIDNRVDQKRLIKEGNFEVEDETFGISNGAVDAPMRVQLQRRPHSSHTHPEGDCVHGGYAGAGVG